MTAWFVLGIVPALPWALAVCLVLALSLVPLLWRDQRRAERLSARLRIARHEPDAAELVAVEYEALDAAGTLTAAPNGPQISMPSSYTALPASEVAIFMNECSGADEPCAKDAKPL